MPASTSARIRSGEEQCGTERADDLGATHGANPMVEGLRRDGGPCRYSIGLWCAGGPAGCQPTGTAQTSQRAVGRVDGARQGGGAGEEAVDPGRGRPSLGDGPHDERLPAARVAGDEDAGDRGHVVVVALDVRALVEVDAELLHQARPLRAEEAHGQQDELGGDLPLGALDLLEAPAAELHLDELTPRTRPSLAEELLGGHGVHALAALLVGGGDAEEHRVGRPRLAGGALLGGPRQDLELVTDLAPWRCEVPRQSAPVSPPPMMMTSLPSAVTWPSTLSPRATRLAGGRKSMAWRTPSSSRPGTGRSRGTVEPIARTTAS